MSDPDRLVICEVGKLDYVIHRYEVRIGRKGTYERKEPVEFLLGRIEDLNSLCKVSLARDEISLEGTVHIWNRHAATRRLMRWIEEHREQLTEERQQELLRYISELDVEYDDEDLSDSTELPEIPFPRALELLESHEDSPVVFRDRAQRSVWRPLPSLLTTGGMPRILEVLSEAGWIFRDGFFRSAVVLCRVVLEDAIKNVALLHIPPGQSVPIREDKLVSLINILPGDLLPGEAKLLAHKIRKEANEALHKANKDIGEEQAWVLLLNTFDVITLLVDRLQAQGKDYPF